MKKIISIIIALVSVLTITVTSITAFAVDLKKEGEYTVNVYLVQKEKDAETPASDGVLKQAKIVVKNGKATMYIYTQPVTITLITATLQGMNVFKTADASDKGEAAKVVSRNADGDPNCFSFTMPHTKEFIRIQVDTGLKFPGVIGARLKIDWSSLKLVKAYTTTTKAVVTTKATTNAKPDKTKTTIASTPVKTTVQQDTAEADTENVTEEIAEEETVAEEIAEDITEVATDESADDFLQPPAEAESTKSADYSLPLMIIAISSVVTAVSFLIIAISSVKLVKRKKK